MTSVGGNDIGQTFCNRRWGGKEVLFAEIYKEDSWRQWEAKR